MIARLHDEICVVFIVTLLQRRGDVAFLVLIEALLDKVMAILIPLNKHRRVVRDSVFVVTRDRRADVTIAVSSGVVNNARCTVQADAAAALGTDRGGELLGKRHIPALNAESFHAPSAITSISASSSIPGKLLPRLDARLMIPSAALAVTKYFVGTFSSKICDKVDSLPPLRHSAVLSVEDLPSD